MAGKQRTLFYACTMLCVVTAVTGVSILIIYASALEQRRVRLLDAVRSQAYLLESLECMNASQGSGSLPGGIFAATLGQTEFGDSGEFTLARRAADTIVFLLRHRTYALEHPAPVPLDWERVEPMRRALAGESGTLIALDYRGEMVLAAYEPIPLLDLGLVAQVDLAEIRAPFVRAGMIAAAVAVVLVGLGATLFVRLTQPFIRRLETRVAQRTAALARANGELQNEIAERRQGEQKLLHYQRELRSLASELALTEERERRQIATDLHDHIGQTLAVTQMKIDALGVLAVDDAQRGYLDEISSFIDQMDEDIRTLTFELSPPVLHELGLAAGVRWQAEQLEKRHGLRITVTDDGRIPAMDEDTRALVFRAIRELLINVVKHARATQVSVALWRENDQGHIVVQDNGVGFDPADGAEDEAGQAFGLFSVRERMGSIGGSLHLESGHGSGTLAHIQVPLAWTPGERRTP